MKYKNLIDNMTLEEKASLCVGKDTWHTNEIERLNIPNIMMADGPNGLRIETKNDRIGDLETPQSKTAVCFPTESTLANSWDEGLVNEVSKAIGNAAKNAGVNILLGPGVNIKRSPLCGRNFEYFSEDPYLAGKLGIAYVKGVQENGVGVCVKHFAVNNQEYNRRLIDVIIDERTLKEIYLKAFEMIVKEAKPYSIMGAYNKINGKYCCDNKELINNTLYNDWNFDGIVITDWSAEDNRVEGIKAGTAIEMPADRANIKEQIIEAVKSGRLDEDVLDKVVDRILTTIYKLVKDANRVNNVEDGNMEINAIVDEEYKNAADELEMEHNIALKAAEESVVLLKNEDDILPIKNKKIALIGNFAKNPRYQGAGSSKVNSYKVENAYDSFISLGYDIDYAKGYELGNSNNKYELQKEAIKVAKRNDSVLVFAGLTELEEAEGLDRNSLDIPENQNELIAEIAKVNRNVIVVLTNGAQILMPWKDSVKGIITGYLGGEAGAKAIVNCIVGKVNPNGKLAETYPLKIEDTPCYNNFPGTDVLVEYKESVYVGYRYYDTVNKDVLFPFGYGLSYTNFEYSNLKIKQNNININLEFTIKNTGNVKGKEIAQIYISHSGNKIYAPKKELKAFTKIELEKGEEKKINIKIDRSSFEHYDAISKKWVVEAGTYKILIGKSIRDIVLEANVEIFSDDVILDRNIPECYKTGKIENVCDEDFEAILGRKIPAKTIKITEISDANSIEQIRNTKIGKYIYEKEIERANKYFEEQNVDKGYRIIKRIQKPIKRFYERKDAKITKKMVDELIDIAKRNEEKLDLDFIKIYFDDSISK